MTSDGCGPDAVALSDVASKLPTAVSSEVLMVAVVRTELRVLFTKGDGI
jgi:hypothetical protein